MSSPKGKGCPSPSNANAHRALMRDSHVTAHIGMLVARCRFQLNGSDHTPSQVVFSLDSTAAAQCPKRTPLGCAISAENKLCGDAAVILSIAPRPATTNIYRTSGQGFRTPGKKELLRCSVTASVFRILFASLHSIRIKPVCNCNNLVAPKGARGGLPLLHASRRQDETERRLAVHYRD
jgi:hypothetical protein